MGRQQILADLDTRQHGSSREPDSRRLARIESKITKLGLYLKVPLEKEDATPSTPSAIIGYDPQTDEPFLEVTSLHTTLYDLDRLYARLETRRPVEVRMRGYKIATIFEKKEVE